jgi:hypothetical protein
MPCRQALGDRRVFRTTSHEVLRDYFCNSMRFFPEEQFFSFEGKEKADRILKPFADRGSNVMNHRVETPHLTLDRERITKDSKKSPLVPLQLYAESQGGFRKAFVHWFQASLPGSGRLSRNPRRLLRTRRVTRANRITALLSREATGSPFGMIFVRNRSTGSIQGGWAPALVNT